MKYQISKSILRLTGITVAVLILIGTSSYFLFAAGAPSSTDAGSGSLRQPQANGNGLLAWYRLDGDAKDSSGNTNNGVLNNFTYDGTTNGWVQGKFGNALLFNGSNSYVAFTSPPSLSGDFTVGAWVNLKTSGTFYDVIVGRSGQDINFNSGRLHLYSGADYVVSTVDNPTNVWTYYMITRIGSTLTLYMNGVSNTSGTWSGTFNPSYIGYGNRSAQTLNGSLDDVRVYNRALSAIEITNLYQGSSPANCDQFCSSYLKLDDGTGTTALNAIRGGSNATLNNFTFTSTNGWTSGVFGGGLLLDGISDYVSLPDQAMTSGTVEFWVNPTTITGDQRLFSQASGATTQAGALSLNQSSGESGSLWVWGGTAWQRLADTGTIGRGFWNHIIVAYNGSSVTAYINGVQTYTTTAACAFSGVPISIGGKSFGSAGNTYSGMLDDFRIYKRFLQPEEAAEHYRLGI